MKEGFKISTQRTRDYKPNLIVKGLGGIVTQAQFFEDSSGSAKNNVRLFKSVGDELHININGDMLLTNYANNGYGNTPTATQQLIGNNIISFIDLENNVRISGARNFSLSNLRELQLNGVSTIPDEGLRNMEKITKLRIPNVTSLGNAALALMATSSSGIYFNGANGDSTIGILTAGQDNIGGKYRYTGGTTYPNFTGVLNLFRNSIIQNNPFPNASSIASQAARECSQLQEVVLNNVTGTFDGRITFFKNSSLTRCIIPNCTGMVGSDVSNTWLQCDSLRELDLRSCKRIDNQVDILLSGMNISNLVVHAHIDQKTSNAGNPSATFQWVINGGGTVNWYNPDGTLNTSI